MLLLPLVLVLGLARSLTVYRDWPLYRWDRHWLQRRENRTHTAPWQSLGRENGSYIFLSVILPRRSNRSGHGIHIYVYILPYLPRDRKIFHRRLRFCPPYRRWRPLFGYKGLSLQREVSLTGNSYSFSVDYSHRPPQSPFLPPRPVISQGNMRETPNIIVRQFGKAREVAKKKKKTQKRGKERNKASKSKGND